MAVEAGRTAAPGGVVRGPQTLWSGLAMVALGLAAFFFLRDISAGTLRAMGPAMLPRILAGGVLLCGLILLAIALRPGIGKVLGFAALALAVASAVYGSVSSTPGTWLIATLAVVFALPVLGSAFAAEPDGVGVAATAGRGPLFVLLGVLLFAITIRGLGPIPALGLIVAGPLAIAVSGLATPEARFGELAVMALALTGACMLLFGDLLNLPIPLYPIAFGELYPAGFSNDARLRATAGAMLLVALVIWLAGRGRRRPDAPVDVADHSGTRI